MRKYAMPAIYFFFGALASLAITKLTTPLPYDLQVHRGRGYELWISSELDLTIPMAPYRYLVRHRKICEDSGNICSGWKTVADFPLDSPYQSDKWKLSESESGLRIEFPEGVAVQQMGQSWVTETGK